MIRVILVNLGTPKSPQPRDVKRYLIEFLTDGRVIDMPWLMRQSLVRRVIVPKRYKTSSQQYQTIFTDEGSPLLTYGLKVQKKLQNILPEGYEVKLAMRYQQPSLEKVIEEGKEAEELIILPLFPQQASATTGSIYQKVMEKISSWKVFPKLTMIPHFYDHPFLIEAFVQNIRQCDYESFDHVLFSFHGLPQKHLVKSDGKNRCGKEGCCNTKEHRIFCYKAQCLATAQGIIDKLGIKKSDYSVCFQSRLGAGLWIKPYTQDRIEQLARSGVKRLLVACPAFVCDCLETLFEIQQEYGKIFTSLGGGNLKLVPGLNDQDMWIECLKDMVLSSTQKLGSSR